MKELPSISVVCPAYNSSTFIEQTLLSIINQTRLPMEIIVVNDGSEDKTERIVENVFNEQCKTISSKLINISHSGPGKARNIGILTAIGDWIAFIDSDDKWEETKIEKVSKLINTMPNVNFFCHNEKILNLDKSSSILNYKSNYSRSISLSKQLFKRNLFSTSAVVCRKDIIIKNGLFDESLQSAQDYELWLKLSNDINVYFIDEVLGTYLVRNNNITSMAKDKKLINSMKIIVKHRNKVSLLIFIISFIKICIKYILFKFYIR